MRRVQFVSLNRCVSFSGVASVVLHDVIRRLRMSQSVSGRRMVLQDTFSAPDKRDSSTWTPGIRHPSTLRRSQRTRQVHSVSLSVVCVAWHRTWSVFPFAKVSNAFGSLRWREAA